jgi:ribonuclease P protein component
VEQSVKYTLGKNERLKSRKAIECLFKEGKSFSMFPFRIIYQFNSPIIINDKNAPQKKGNLRAAFSVSKKYFKRAIDRNRIKRLMRESYRLQKNELENMLQEKSMVLYLFIIYSSNEMPTNITIAVKMNAMCRRLIKIVNEK